jgi:hypothetical protein
MKASSRRPHSEASPFSKPVLSLLAGEAEESAFPESFTTRYVFDMLVFYEEYSHVVSARMRERKSRDGDARRKLKLILAENPDWEDLSLEWEGDPGWILVPEARPRLKPKLP